MLQQEDEAVRLVVGCGVGLAIRTTAIFSLTRLLLWIVLQLINEGPCIYYDQEVFN